MESENQHLYGARTDSAPCAWSRPGASAMARVVSRKHSRREVPRVTRSRSLTPKRAKQRERRVLAALNAGGAGKMVESVGSGYLPPHRASVASMSAEVRYAAGIDSGMIPLQGWCYPHQLYAVHWEGQLDRLQKRVVIFTQFADVKRTGRA